MVETYRRDLQNACPILEIDISEQLLCRTSQHQIDNYDPNASQVFVQSPDTGIHHVSATKIQRMCPSRRGRGRCFVMAADMSSVPLTAPLGLRLTMYPLTGNGLTAPLAEGRYRPPGISVNDLRYKVVYACL
ncbi:MAG: hypothetical protein ACOYNZ_15560 [Rhodoferax sp.]